MATVVVTGRLPDETLGALRDAGHEVRAWEHDGPVPRDQLLALVEGADALVTLVTERVDAELLDAAGPGVRVVANVAVGYDNVDVPVCADRGVVVTNTPGVLRRPPQTWRWRWSSCPRAGWARPSGSCGRGRSGSGVCSYAALLGRGLQGRTLGIVGLGGIGRATARRARAFGMHILYTGRRDAPSDVVEELGARRVELAELLEAGDVVSMHLPYSAATHHLVGADELARLGPTSYLVNTARGPVVDEEALVHALQEGTIAGAGLDVYEHEPRVHPGLLELENVVLLPHVGSATVETRTGMALLAARNVVAVLAGEDPVTPVG
ncbi:NAD(P)-dependent oxidoreductase [Ornithinimicrobium sp. W1665]|uniref:NAD(P)-dependent oxidoreductase n=1 Tax=Ornithinimicrobium sp. W1665 TaxID=3416666 RepID=UPI003D6A2670